MGLQNFIVPWILYLTCEVTVAGTENQSHMQEHNLEHTMSTTIRNDADPSNTLVVQTHLQNFQESNLVWTDFMTDRQFGQFRFGIGISPDLSSNMIEAASSLLRIRGTEKLFLTVTTETNRSDVGLVITSCKLVSKNRTKSYFIQDGCLDNRLVENISREDNKMVFTLHLSRVAQISGSSMVFISCEVKLCLDSNHSKSCGSSCPLLLLSKQPPEPLLETRSYHITAKPIYVIQETRKKGKYQLHYISKTGFENGLYENSPALITGDSCFSQRATTNYAAMVIGMVLGATVLAVVVLLVRKSFSGVRRRNILMEL